MRGRSGRRTGYGTGSALSGGGEGLGTLGLHEPKLRELARGAGFSNVRRIQMKNPFNNLYELTP